MTEQLEHIIKTHEKRKEQLKNGKMVNFSHPNDISYLIKQAKLIDEYKDSLKSYMEETSELQYRVKELEGLNQLYKQNLEEVIQWYEVAYYRNQRYKQALEHIAVERLYESELMESIKFVAREALGRDRDD
ncbi:putative RNase H-like nuclease (RuvC/YqgF family) [Virgibacillus natechei]|uniref:RNase H-like nuclease (RuvC/YqgF family) n=2 Tax=Virgibacillus natechei TaxID=1216297 RepID=A0ABS4IL11_9BACI|nr:putative RNase H-like nuclease (RuvC/YqgF family) [Virgibacillus natechei]